MGVLEGSGPQPRGGAAPCPPAGAPGLTGARGGAGGPTKVVCTAPHRRSAQRPAPLPGRGRPARTHPGRRGPSEPLPGASPRLAGSPGARAGRARVSPERAEPGAVFQICVFFSSGKAARSGSSAGGRAAGGGGEWLPLRSAPCRSVPLGGGSRAARPRRRRPPPRARSPAGRERHAAGVPGSINNFFGAVSCTSASFLS